MYVYIYIYIGIERERERESKPCQVRPRSEAQVRARARARAEACAALRCASRPSACHMQLKHAGSGYIAMLAFRDEATESKTWLRVARGRCLTPMRVAFCTCHE